MCCCSFFKVLLDDSIINVGTVASSRYVVPIKLRVDKLLKQLTLFNQTLVNTHAHTRTPLFVFVLSSGICCPLVVVKILQPRGAVCP